MNDDLPSVLPLEEFRNVITGSYADVRADFQKHFEPGIENFVLLTYEAYKRIQTIEESAPNTERAAWTYQYLYAAMNFLVCGFHLQISGFLIPAGNQMRQFGESIAMALLCAHREVDTFARLMVEKEQYPVHRAIIAVKTRRNAKLLDLDTTGWDDFEKITKFYDDLSHPSIFAASSLQVFAVPGAKSLGGAFDEAKLEFYEKEMRYSHTAAMRLVETTEHCIRLLNLPPPADAKSRVT
jgi:hypothetical protein